MGGTRRKRQTTDPDLIVERRLLQRRRLRLALFITLSALGLSVLLTHWGQGGDGDDWARFDRHQGTVVSVSLDGSLGVQLAGEAGQTPVRLLGIAMPRAGTPQAADASRELALRSLGREFTLRLEPLQTRSADGALLAYLYISDTDNLNLDMVKDGHVYADRRSPYSLQVSFDQAESDARKKRRGMWSKPGDEQMPEWRKQWLKEFRDRTHRTSAE